MQTLTLIKLVQFSIGPWRQHLTTEQGGKKVTYAIFFKPTQHPQHSGWLLGNIEMKNIWITSAICCRTGRQAVFTRDQIMSFTCQLKQSSSFKAHPESEHSCLFLSLDMEGLMEYAPIKRASLLESLYWRLILVTSCLYFLSRRIPFCEQQWQRNVVRNLVHLSIFLPHKCPNTLKERKMFI